MVYIQYGPSFQKHQKTCHELVDARKCAQENDSYGMDEDTCTICGQNDISDVSAQ